MHNTQPWRLHLRDDRLDVYVDRARQLTVLDPTSRQMIISVGCAVMNARVSAAGDGIGLEVARFPDTLRPDLLASLVATAGPVDASVAALDHVIELRQTNRRQFADEEVPASATKVLTQAADAEGARLFVIRDPDQRVAVAALSRHADDVVDLNPAYRAELRAWSSDDPGRRDGVPGLAVPHVDRTSCLAVLCTDADTPIDWLRAGEALERVLLEITRQGYTASPLIQVTEVPSTRAQLRSELGLSGHPHVLLRIGRAPVTPSSRRRRLVDVLVDEN